MSYLLDTNTCIRFLNGRSERIKAHFASAHPDEIFLSSIVKAELFYGARKSQHPDKNLAKQLLFVNRFVSLPFDDQAADSYGRIRSYLENEGTPIGPNDLMIAAIALSHNLTLITHNTKEFSRVRDLLLEDWEM